MDNTGNQLSFGHLKVKEIKLATVFLLLKVLFECDPAVLGTR
jgi:hypothetical protein